MNTRVNSLTKMLLVGLVAFSASAFAESVGDESKRLLSRMSELRPDPANEETIDAQLALIQDTREFLKRAFQESQPDIKVITLVLVKIHPYEQKFTCVEVNLSAVNRHWRAIDKELKALTANRTISARAERSFRISVAFVRDEAKYGNDR